MRTTRIGVLALSCLCLLAGGCSSNKSATASTSADKAMVASATPINTKCPYSGKPVTEGMVAQFEGKTVGFCCAGCQGKFAAATNDQKKAMVAKATN